MNDRELDRLIARANPYGDQTVADLPTGGAEADLLEEIVSTKTLAPVDDPGSPVRRSRRRFVLVAVAAVTALIALAGVFLPQGGGNPVAPPQAYAAEVIAVAEANPRLLIDDPGWKISYVEEFSAPQGMLQFTKGAQTVDLMWMRAGDYRSYYADRKRESAPTPVTVLGQQASMFHYSGADYTTMLPPRGSVFIEVRANLGSLQEYRRMLGQLKPVDVNTWLDALPASAVRPEQKKAVVDGMLADIPLPPRFDRSKLYTATTTERYLVGAHVTGTVTCAWIDRWADAKKSGDDKVVRESVDALQSSKSWRILKEMQARGAFSEVLWEYADAVRDGKVLLEPNNNPKALTVDGIRGGFCQS